MIIYQKLTNKRSYKIFQRVEFVFKIFVYYKVFSTTFKKYLDGCLIQDKMLQFLAIYYILLFFIFIITNIKVKANNIIKINC